MYRLLIFPFEIDGTYITDEFYYINDSYIPRKSEIIERLRLAVENDDGELNYYLLKAEVQSVHYELFKDNSVMPVVYVTVIEIEKVEEE